MCRFALRVAGPILLLLALVGPAAATAQDATPTRAESLLGAMGYPELHIRVTEDTYEMSTTSVAAGRILITLENAGQESWHGFLLRLPEGVSAEQAASDIGPFRELPSWLFDAQFPGFPGETPPGERRHAVVDLTAGRYLVVSDVVQPFEVVQAAATPEVGAGPSADGIVRLFEYGFQLPERLAPGRQVWEVTNAGREPHELLLARAPGPVTVDQIMAAMAAEGEEEATPIPGVPSLEDLVAVGGVGWLSPGVTALAEVALEAGTYVAACFVIDPATGMPHAVMGMVDVFTVGGDGGTPTAEIPATPVGDQLAWVLAQINGAAASLTEADVVAHAAPRFLAELPAPVALDLLRQPAAGFAPVAVTGFAYPPTPTGAIALVTAGTGEHGALVLTIEAEPPHRITRLELSEPPAPPRPTGRRVDVGGRALFLDCPGTGGPTVVLEGGLAADWAAVQPAVAASTRVCSYDRPDSPASHSDPAAIRTAREVADELHALLAASGEPGPYVLVGHSLGGLYVQLFAYRNPEEVAGLVLVDPTPEGFAERLDVLEAALFGAPPPNLVAPDGSLPPTAEETSYAQMRAARRAGPLRPVPLVVLSHGRAPTQEESPAGLPIAEEERILRELHEEIVGVVPNGRHVVAEGSGHDIHKQRPDQVVEAIRQVVEAVRDPGTWATPPAATPTS